MDAHILYHHLLEESFSEIVKLVVCFVLLKTMINFCLSSWAYLFNESQTTYHINWLNFWLETDSKLVNKWFNRKNCFLVRISLWLVFSNRETTVQTPLQTLVCSFMVCMLGTQIHKLYLGIFVHNKLGMPDFRFVYFWGFWHNPSLFVCFFSF